MRLPKIITTVLEGESLVNDASALIIYRCAITATLSGSFNLFDASFQFFIVSSGGIIIGLLLGILINWILTKIHNSNIEVSITLMTPYISYLAAEHLHLSGVLAVVTTGIYLAWHISETFSFESRMKAFSFWTVFCFILNGFVFILIGLQLPEIIHSHSNYSIFELSCYGLIISLITILTRLIWIFPISKLVYRLNKFLRPQSIGKLTAPQSSHLLIAAWSGMRGVVSLASALALPITLSNGNAFPLRNEILFITFIVILVTLVGQGLTLPFLVKKLQIEEPLSKIIEDDRRLRIMFLENTINFINNHLSISLDLTTHNFLLNSYQQRLKFFNTKRDETITTLKPGGPDYTPNINPNYLNAEAEIIKFQRT